MRETYLWDEELDVGDVDFVDETVDGFAQGFPAQSLELCAGLVLLLSVLHHGAESVRRDVRSTGFGVDELLHFLAEIDFGDGNDVAGEFGVGELEGHLAFALVESLSVRILQLGQREIRRGRCRTGSTGGRRGRARSGGAGRRERQWPCAGKRAGGEFTVCACGSSLARRSSWRGGVGAYDGSEVDWRARTGRGCGRKESSDFARFCPTLRAQNAAEKSAASLSRAGPR